VIEGGEIVDITMIGQPKWEVEFPLGMHGNKGLEGLAFVPVEGSAEGGYFVIGDQTSAEARTECTLPILTKTGCGNSDNRCQCVGHAIKPEGWREVSSVSFVSSTSFSSEGETLVSNAGVLLVESDHDNSLQIYNSSSPYSLILELPLPASSAPGQEGVTLVGCSIYIACDDGSDRKQVLRYTIQPCTCPPSTSSRSLLSPPPPPHIPFGEVVFNKFLVRSLGKGGGPGGTDAGWIQLYNTLEDQDSDLSELTITDKGFELDRGAQGFQFPQGTQLGALSSMYLIADNTSDGSLGADSFYHLPFLLAEEDGLFLTDNFGNILDHVIFKANQPAGAPTGIVGLSGNSSGVNTTISFEVKNSNISGVVWGRPFDGGSNWGMVPIPSDWSGTPEFPSTDYKRMVQSPPPSVEELTHHKDFFSLLEGDESSYTRVVTWVIIMIVFGFAAILWSWLQFCGWNNFHLKVISYEKSGGEIEMHELEQFVIDDESNASEYGSSEHSFGDKMESLEMLYKPTNE